MHPENLQTWLMEGADYNVWKTPVLMNDLQLLKAGYPITSPVDGSKIPPAKFILFDAPLGRTHFETGRFIDFMVFIDTPLDVAMARRLLRDILGDAEQGAEDTITRLKANLSRYLDGTRLLYLEFQNQMKRTCNLVLDGRLTVDELATAIDTTIKQRQPNQSLGDGVETAVCYSETLVSPQLRNNGSIMPTVLRVGRYRFYFFSNEGQEPPHIHVKANSDQAKFWLDPLALASK